MRSLVCSLILSVAVLGLANAAPAPAKVRLPGYKTVILDNGMTVMLMERHDLPLVTLRWVIPSAGSLGDPAGKEGLAMLTAQMLRKGTPTHTASQIAEAVDFVGGKLESGTEQQFAAGAAEFVSKDFASGLDLVVETLLKPSFPEDELKKMVQQEIDGIKQAKEVPGEVIPLYYQRFLYGTHPYARPSGGTETTLAGITREDLIAFYNKWYAPDGTFLSVVGDFATPAMEQALRTKFKPWSKKTVQAAPLPEPQAVPGRNALLVEKPDATQVFFRVGNVALARTNPDWIPVQVVNTLFGGRFTSMLNTELRIQSGLTYHASTSFGARKLPGPFTMYFYTGNETGLRAVKMALEVLAKLHANGITPEQLQSAKAYIEGQFGPTLQTNDELADTLCDLKFYGLGPEYIDTYLDKVSAMTQEDAKRVIEKYFPLKDLSFVIIGQGPLIETIGKAVSDKTSKVSITDPGF
jgi:zinc protease